MMIAITHDQMVALSAPTLTYAWLVDLPFETYLTTHADDVVVEDKSYLASAHIQSIPMLSRSQGIKVQDLSLTFTQQQTELQDLFSRPDIFGQGVSLKLVLFTEDGQPVSHRAIDVYKGYFDHWTHHQNPKRELITVVLSSPWSKPNKTSGRLANPAEHQKNHSTDKFFEFSYDTKKILGWGGEV
ncbi:hypothetical protein QGN29_10925 [Temperatibacter marinus]|uniref:Uncharacterized protein n=1 Tax=Temperatibacter marinus TaxID=1456591 RepID=A0AA52H9U7_9PROT|nr:hypothetical protein [Temperatibacter marinus]WND02060.1 hypothetical protein QGN29_10925 [Temperatibacter marinus]